MALAGTEITKAISSGVWKAFRDGQPITADDLKVGPNSVDLQMGDTLLRVMATADRFIDPHKPDSMRAYEVDRTDRSKNGGWILQPGNLYLANVRESFDSSLPLWIEQETFMAGGTVDIVGKSHFYQVIDGRSSAGRIGLSVHSTAGRGDAGWGGQFAQFTLELTVAIPLLVRPSMRIAQLYFEEISGVPEPYAGAYVEQIGVKPAVLGPDRF